MPSTEGNQSFRRAEFDRLNDIVAGGVPGGNDLKAELFIEVRRKNRTFNAPAVTVGARTVPDKRKGAPAAMRRLLFRVGRG